MEQFQQELLYSACITEHYRIRKIVLQNSQDLTHLDSEKQRTKPMPLSQSLLIPNSCDVLETHDLLFNIIRMKSAFSEGNAMRILTNWKEFL